MDVANINSQPLTPVVVEPMHEPVAAASVEVQQAAPEKNGSEQRPNAGFMPDNLDDKKLDDMLSKGISEINKKLALVSSEMSYSYHKPTRSIAVTVFNAETKEVVREIPPQKALDALAKMWELAGIMIDEKR